MTHPRGGYCTLLSTLPTSNSLSVSQTLEGLSELRALLTSLPLTCFRKVGRSGKTCHKIIDLPGGKINPRTVPARIDANLDCAFVEFVIPIIGGRAGP